MLYTDRFMTNRTPINDQATVNKLVEENMNLVPYVFTKFIHPNKAILREKEEIIAIGNIALWEAAMAYDETKAAFSTFAVKIIKDRMVHYITTQSKNFIGNTISLNTIVDDEDGIELLSLIADPSTIDVIKDPEVLHKLELFDEYIDNYAEPREQSVIKKHLYEGYKYDDIAKEYGVTRQRIEQIQRRCLNKFYRWYDARIKQEYVEEEVNVTKTYKQLVKDSRRPLTGYIKCKSADMADLLGYNINNFHRMVKEYLDCKTDFDRNRCDIVKRCRDKGLHVKVIATFVSRQYSYSYYYQECEPCLGTFTLEVNGENN